MEKKNLPTSFIENHEAAEYAAKFLGVDPNGLEMALCTKSTITRGERIVSPLSASSAQDVCDAFVKGIYGRQFIWIVDKVNQVIFQPKVSTSLIVIHLMLIFVNFSYISMVEIS